MCSMEFIANVNVEKQIVDFLRNKGFDTKWVAEINKRMKDDEVCRLAYDEKRIIITNDKDFGEIVFL
ncbi:MAG: DUF5615 family PIN-like protein [Candidatus Hydrogenedentota bacterium]